jgi:hypothetical protein
MSDPILVTQSYRVTLKGSAEEIKQDLLDLSQSFDYMLDCICQSPDLSDTMYLIDTSGDIEWFTDKEFDASFTEEFKKLDVTVLYKVEFEVEDAGFEIRIV